MQSVSAADLTACLAQHGQEAGRQGGRMRFSPGTSAACKAVKEGREVWEDEAAWLTKPEVSWDVRLLPGCSLPHQFICKRVGQWGQDWVISFLQRPSAFPPLRAGGSLEVWVLLRKAFA